MLANGRTAMEGSGLSNPSKWKEKSVDHRSDIFSLGILLYEMAAGRRPFEGDSMAAVMSSIRGTPRDP